MSLTALPSIARAGAEATPLDPARLTRAKSAYTTRRVSLEPGTGLLDGPDVVPVTGDVVLATVTAVGQHKRIERPDGRRAMLFPGDDVIVAYGGRYAPDQYEAEVPDDLGPCDLVAAGGVAARMISSHANMGQPTQLEPIGLLCDPTGRRVNLADWALHRVLTTPPKVPTFAVVGTAMNAGKSTTVAGMVRGMRAAGLTVGTAKVTGTGAGGDLWLMADAGAEVVVDFTAAGLPSTYMTPVPQLEDVLEHLRDHLAAAGVDVIVIEVADGLYQCDTAGLVSGARFLEAVDGVVFAAGDALGAKAGVDWLLERDIPVLGVSGLLTASPLAAREADQVLDVPVFDLEALGAPDIAAALGAKGVAQPAA